VGESGPNILVDALDTPDGSILVLESDERVPIDVSTTVLDQYLRRCGHSPLTEVCQRRRTTVYHESVRMSESEWSTISAILRDSPNAKEALNCPSISRMLRLSYSEVVRLSRRLYGGLGSPGSRRSPTLYTMAPIDFRPDANVEQPWYLSWRRKSWYYWLLSAPGWRVFWTRVDVGAGAVHIQGGTIRDHFLEPHSS
jgi:hypothetical protein